MATPLQVSEAFPTCQLCKTNISGSSRTRRLACQHLFCSECLPTYRTEPDNLEFDCPTCNQAVRVPPFDGAECDDDTRPGDVDVLPVTCTSCDDAEAVIYCEDCTDFLCSFCLDAHKRVKKTRNHSLVTTPVTQGALSRDKSDCSISSHDPARDPDKSSVKQHDHVLKLQQTKCSVHTDNFVISFCIDCWKLLCLKCLPNHFDEKHKVVDLQEACEKFTVDVRSKLESIQARVSKLEDDLEEGVQAERFSESKNAVIKNIESCAHLLHTSIEQCKNSLLEKINGYDLQRKASLSNYQKQTETCITSLNHYKEIVQNVKQDGCIEMLKSVDSETIDAIQNLTEVELEILLYNPERNVSKINEWLNNMFGTLVVNTCCPGKNVPLGTKEYVLEVEPLSKYSGTKDESCENTSHLAARSWTLEERLQQATVKKNSVQLEASKVGFIHGGARRVMDHHTLWHPEGEKVIGMKLTDDDTLCISVAARNGSAVHCVDKFLHDLRMKHFNMSIKSAFFVECDIYILFVLDNWGITRINCDRNLQRIDNYRIISKRRLGNGATDFFLDSSWNLVVANPVEPSITTFYPDINNPRRIYNTGHTFTSKVFDPTYIHGNSRDEIIVCAEKAKCIKCFTIMHRGQCTEQWRYGVYGPTCVGPNDYVYILDSGAPDYILHVLNDNGKLMYCIKLDVSGNMTPIDMVVASDNTLILVDRDFHLQFFKMKVP